MADHLSSDRLGAPVVLRQLSAATAADESVFDLLIRMKQNALAASDVTLSASPRAAPSGDFKAQRDQINRAARHAPFTGAEPFGAGGAKMIVLARADGAFRISLGPRGLVLAAGVGAHVDHDLTKERAWLQALQVKQRLGAHALPIASQGWSRVLARFQ